MSTDIPAPLTITLVVFGASRSGKTSLLRSVHERLGAGRGMIGGDDPHRYMPLDWLSLDLGTIGGRPATVLMYAVPGMESYDATRRLLLDRADGVIVVADSQASRLEHNVEAIETLREHLEHRMRRGDRPVPVICFHSKRDLPAELLVAPEQLDAALAVGDAPSVQGDAVRGEGIREALQGVLTLVLRQHGATGATDE